MDVSDVSKLARKALNKLEGSATTALGGDNNSNEIDDIATLAK